MTAVRTTSEQRVWITLAALARYGPVRVERIVHESGVTERTVRRHLRRFVRTGIVATEKLPGYGGPRGYRLLTKGSPA